MRRTLQAGDKIPHVTAHAEENETAGNGSKGGFLAQLLLQGNGS